MRLGHKEINLNHIYNVMIRADVDMDEIQFGGERNRMPRPPPVMRRDIEPFEGQLHRLTEIDDGVNLDDAQDYSPKQNNLQVYLQQVMDQFKS